jgi:glycine cleavage system aminomethyltransferase T
MARNVAPAISNSSATAMPHGFSKARSRDWSAWGAPLPVAFSPSLDHWIGLGLLQRGPTRVGECVRAVDPVRNNVVEVEVCAPCFVDPAGERLRA